MGLTADMTRRQALLAMGAMAMAACFSDRPDGGTGPDDGTVIDMTNQLTFSPERVEIRVGDRVTWRNTSDIVHTATCDPDQAADPSNVSLPAGAAAWDSGILTSGSEFSRVFDVPGEYRYICLPHEPQGMFGTIVVSS